MQNGKEQSPARVYLLWGDDVGALRRRHEQLRQSILSGPDSVAGMESFNHERFEGPYTASIFDVTRACAQAPMMASVRLVELSDPDRFGQQVSKGAKSSSDGDGEEESGGKRDKATTSEQAIDVLLSYIDSPVASTTLILTSTGLTGVSRLVKRCQKHENVSEERFSTAKDSSAQGEVIAWASAEGYAIDASAASRLLALVGNASHHWIPPLERARSFAGTREIAVEDVEAVVIESKEVDVFEFIKALSRKDVVATLELLTRLLPENVRDPGVVLRLLGLLIWQFRRLLTMKVHPDPASALNIPSFRLGEVKQQASNFSVRELVIAYRGLMAVDAALKGGSAVAQASALLVVQRWAMMVCGADTGVEHSPS